MGWPYSLLTAAEELLWEERKKFSHGKLKHFVRWLFFHFPSVSPKDIKSALFWTKRDDPLGDDFYPLFVKIQSVVKNQEA